MTIDEAANELQEDIELYIPLHGTIDDVDRELPDGRLITALEMAIKSLEAWEKVKEEIKSKTFSRYVSNYDLGLCRALDVIDKHLQEVTTDADRD